jgi:hypothetical protein
MRKDFKGVSSFLRISAIFYAKFIYSNSPGPGLQKKRNNHLLAMGWDQNRSQLIPKISLESDEALIWPIIRDQLINIDNPNP